MNVTYRLFVLSLLTVFLICADGAFAKPISNKSDGENSADTRKKRFLKPSENREALDRLRKAIQEEYSYRDLHAIDWDNQFRAYGPRLEKAKTPQAFAELMAKMLAKNKDYHLYLDVNGQSYSAATAVKRMDVNFNLSALAKIVPNWREVNLTLYTGRYPEGIGYLMISSWHNDPKQVPAILEILKEFRNTQGLIIDVRPNGGGSEAQARSVAAFFVDEPKVYAKHFNRIPGPVLKFSEMQERIVSPSKNHLDYKGKIVVLMGRACASACESFLLMMKQVPNCTLVGDTSCGSSANPKLIDLGNGVEVRMPSWKALLPDGTCFEGCGIEPDIKVKTTRAQFRKEDPILKMGLKVILSDEPLNIANKKKPKPD